MAGLQVASLFGVIELFDKFSPGLKTAEKNAQEFGKGVGGAIEKVSALSGAMSAVPGAAFLIGATKSAIDFDKTMVNVGSILGKNKSQMQALNAEVLNIGKNSIAGPQAAAEAFTDIVGGVADASTHMAILNAAIKTSEAGNANLQSTTQGLISVMNSYKFSADSASYVSDILTQTVGKGVGTMDQFVSAIGPIAGLAASSGVSIKELATAMAFMTTKGTSAAQAATQSQAAMTALLKPNKALDDLLAKVKVSTEGSTAAGGKWVTTTRASTDQLAKWNDELAKNQAQLDRMAGKKKKDALDNVNIAEKQGKIAELQGKIAQGGQTVKYQQGAAAAQKVTAEWLLKTYGMVGALNKLKEAAGGSSQKMAEALGSVEALRAFVTLTGADWNEFSKDFDNGLKGATDTARNIQLQSVSAQFELLKSNLAGVAIAAGNVLLPALGGLFSIINSLINAVNQFDPNLLGLVAAFTALGVVVPAILPLLGLLAGATTPLLVPIAALAGAFTAVKLAWDSDFGGIRTSVTKFWTDIQPTLATIKGGIDTFFAILNQPTAMSLDTEGMDAAGARLTKKLNTLDPNDALTKGQDIDFGTKLKTAIDTAWPIVEPAIKSLIDKAVALIATLIPNLINAVITLGSQLATTLGNQLSQVDWGSLVSSLLNSALTFGGDLISNLLSGLTNLYTDLTAKLSEIDAVDLGKQAAGLLGKALQFGADLIGKIVSGLTGGGTQISGQISTETGGLDFATMAAKLLEAAVKFSTTLLGKIVEGLVGFGGQLASDIGAELSKVDLLAQAKTLIDGGLKIGGDLINNAVTSIGALGNDLGAAIAKNFGSIDVGAAAKSLLDGALKIGSNLISNVVGGIAALGHDLGFSIGDNLKSIDIMAAASSLLTEATNLASRLISALVDGLKDLPTKVIAKLGEGFNAVGDFVGDAVNRLLGRGGGAPSAPPPPATTNAPAPGGGGQASAGVSVGQQAFIGVKADDTKGTAQNPVIVRPIAAPGQQNAQGAPAQPAAPVNLAPVVAPVAAQAAGQAGAQIAMGGQNPVEPIVQQAVAWLQSTGATMLTAAFRSAMEQGSAAFQAAGMASILAGVMNPLNLAMMWVNTVGRAGVVTTFAALATSANASLKGVGSSMVSAVADALIRIATMIGNLPNGVGAQLAAGIRAAAASGRARGGDLRSGTFLVGENGPELIQLGAGASGHVYENSLVRGAKGNTASSNGGGITLHNPVFQGVQDPESLLEKLEQVAGRYNQTIMRPI